VFSVKDGEQIFLAAVSDAQWNTFCDAMGYADLKGWIDKLPDTGLPKLAVAGIIAKVGGHYTSGKGGDILNGAGDAALTVMAYQWGSSAGIERTTQPDMMKPKLWIG